MNKKYLSLLSILLLILSLSNCGSDMQTESEGEGSIAFDLALQETTPYYSEPSLQEKGEDTSQLPRYAVTCSSTIYTIEATIYNSSNSSVASGSWSCSAHSGSLTNISAGSNYKLVILGKDTSGNITYRGETTGITVTAGQSTSAGTITLSNFIPTLSSSSGSTISSGSSLSLSWSGSGSTYQLQISSSSSFSSLAVDTTSSSSLSLSSGTYYWRIRAIDSYSNGSDWSSARSFTVSSAVAVTITISSSTATITTSTPSGGNILYYSTDFSSNPNWLTSGTGNQWNSTQGVFNLNLPNNTDPYALSSLNWTGGSFKIQFDVVIDSNQWSSGFTFGLFSSSKNIFNANVVYIIIGSADRGKLTQIYAYDSTGSGVTSSENYPSAFSIGQWYTCILSYDSSTKIVSYTLTNKDTNSLVLSDQVTIASGFSSGAYYFGVSRVGVNYGSYTTTARIDNVYLYETNNGTFY